MGASPRPRGHITLVSPGRCCRAPACGRSLGRERGLQKNRAAFEPIPPGPRQISCAAVPPTAETFSPRSTQGAFAMSTTTVLAKSAALAALTLDHRWRRYSPLPRPKPVTSITTTASASSSAPRWSTAATAKLQPSPLRLVVPQGARTPAATTGGSAFMSAATATNWPDGNPADEGPWCSLLRRGFSHQPRRGSLTGSMKMSPPIRNRAVAAMPPPLAAGHRRDDARSSRGAANAVAFPEKAKRPKYWVIRSGGARRASSDRPAA